MALITCSKCEGIGRVSHGVSYERCTTCGTSGEVYSPEPDIDDLRRRVEMLEAANMALAELCQRLESSLSSRSRMSRKASPVSRSA